MEYITRGNPLLPTPKAAWYEHDFGPQQTLDAAALVESAQLAAETHARLVAENGCEATNEILLNRAVGLLTMRRFDQE